MVDWFGLGLVVVFGAAGVWLVVRARRAERRWLKWIGILAGGLVAFLGVAVFLAAVRGYAKLYAKHDNPVPVLTVAGTAEQVERGKRYAVFCAACHASTDKPPMDGSDFLGEDAPPIGTFYAPNLTPVHLADWTDGEIVRAIREGIHKSGRSLIIMPSEVFRHVSDEDVEGIVAYLRAQPPVEPDTPEPKFNVLAALFFNVVPIFVAQPPITEPILAPPKGTAEYGGYLVSIVCEVCHGEDLGGDAQMESPGLIGAALAWSADDLLTLLRTGIKPDGVAVDGERMPWEMLSDFFIDDDDIRSVYLHLQMRFSPPVSN